MTMRFHFIRISLVLLIITWAMSACTDLQEDLNDEITEDIRLPGNPDSDPGSTIHYLDNVFDELRHSGTANHGSYYTVQEITSDEMVVTVKGSDWSSGGELQRLHTHTYNPHNPFLISSFNGQYTGISKCNELLQTLSDPNEIAQIRVLRAFFYMRLCDMFGRVKIITEPGVDAPQVERLEVFQFIEQELLDAIGVAALSSDMDLIASELGADPNPYQVNVYGALGLLSKLYLNAEIYAGTPRWEEAAIAAGLVIDSGVYQLCGAGCSVPNLGRRPSISSDPEHIEGYAAVFAPNNENNPEHIFTVFYDEVSAGGMNFSQMNLHYNSQLTWNLSEQPWNGYATLEEFYNSYDDRDLRKKANFIVGPQLDFGGSAILDYTYDEGVKPLVYTPEINELYPNSTRGGGARPTKFSYKQFGKVDMDNDYPIVRLGEMYLNRAEGLARSSGDWNDALPDVNIIRRRANMPDYSFIDEHEFLAERGREMFQESSRRTDLIRFGKYNDAWWEKPVDPSDHVNIFPIPFFSFNTEGWTQNPGY